MTPAANLNAPLGSRANLITRASEILQRVFERRRAAEVARFQELRGAGAFVAPFGCGLVGRQAELGLGEPLILRPDAAEAG